MHIILIFSWMSVRFQDWYAKTPMSKKRALALTGDNKENEKDKGKEKEKKGIKEKKKK